MPKANVRIWKSGNTRGTGNPPRVTVQNNADESRFVKLTFNVEGRKLPASTVVLPSKSGQYDMPTPQEAYQPGARVLAVVKLYTVKGHGQKGDRINQQSLIW